jgi:drug/metabolite transporter (DMT)-like permease
MRKNAPFFSFCANIRICENNEEESTVRKTAAAYLGLVLVFVLWGSLYVVSSVVLQYMPTFAVMFCRFVIAFAALSIIVKAGSRKWNPDGTDEQGRKTKTDGPGWKYVILLGVLGYAVGVGVQLMGTKYAGSSMASLINSLNPVAISLMAVPILHEKLTGNKIIGILLAVFGVYLILGTGGTVNLPGILMSLASVLLWSLVSVLTRQGLAKYNPLVITRNAIGVAAVCEFIFTVSEHVLTHSTIHLNGGVIAGLLYLGVFCTGVSYILWNQGLAVLPASSCSALYPIQPLTSTVMGVIFFHETVGLSFAAGAVFIIVGVLLCLLGEKLMKHRKTAGLIRN